MIQSGRALGDSLTGVPLAGSQLEQFIVVVAIVLALLLALVTLVLGLNRCSPWRSERLRRLRAARRAIRTAPRATDAPIEHVLAMGTVCRLGYSTLPGYTPNPPDDRLNGRHDRLARAELASVGLRP